MLVVSVHVLQGVCARCARRKRANEQLPARTPLASPQYVNFEHNAAVEGQEGDGLQPAAQAALQGAVRSYDEGDGLH